MPKKFSLPALFLLFIFITGCVPQSAAPTSDLLATVVAGTLSVIQTNTTQPEVGNGPFMITPTPELFTSTPQQIPSGTKRVVTTSADNLNLRVGPGRLFQVSRVLAKGTELELLSIAPGGKWIQVRNKEGIIGWVDGFLVNGLTDSDNASEDFPTGVFTITGFVENESGPITYVGIAIVQGNQFDEAFTDETGRYILYVPKTLNGEWIIQFYATDCRSNTMDSNCQCLNGTCGKLDPEGYRLTFPTTVTSAFFRFGWK